MALSVDQQIEELNELIRFDRDAIGAYTEAINAVHDARVRDPLARFRGDHERHVSELSALVRGLGGKPAGSPDIKGAARKLMTKIAGLVGEESVLKAMKSNEEAINKAYDHHVRMDFPDEILEVIKRNFQDEKRHLEWVEQALRNRIWEQAGAHP
jgi:uncharacterized protein (TIGR02284 family)